MNDRTHTPFEIESDNPLDSEGVLLMGRYVTRESLETLSDEELDRRRVYPIEVDTAEMEAHERLIAAIKARRVEVEARRIERQERLRAAMSEEQGPATVESLLESNNILMQEMIAGQERVIQALQSLGESFAATGSLAEMLFGSSGEGTIEENPTATEEDEEEATFEDYRENERGTGWEVKNKGKWRKATRLEAAEIRAIISRRGAR